MQTTAEAVASRLVDRYHVEMDIYQVSENCMDALNQMGMLYISKKAVAGHVKDQKLRMPVDCFDPRAVYRLPSSRDTLTNTVTLTIQDITFPPQKVFIPIPNSDSEVQSLQLPEEILNFIPTMAGPYIDFVWDPPFLKFNETNIDVAVVYRGIPINSETGLAEIPEEAFEGCLKHCLYIWHEPLFLQGKVAPFIWTELKEWHRKGFAKSMNRKYFSELNQNEMSKVHNIMASMDRKQTRVDS